jgi:putative transposase
MQYVKGGFSYRVKKELGSNMEVWQRGFSDHRIRDGQDYAIHVVYTHSNPVRKRLCGLATEYPYSSAFPRFELDPVPQGLKPFVRAASGTAEAVPFQSKVDDKHLECADYAIIEAATVPSEIRESKTEKIKS